MTVLWWAWARMTVYANHFDTDAVVFRLHLQAGMLAVVGLAASTSAAVGPNSAKFVGCCVLLRRLLVSLYARASGSTGRPGHREVRPGHRQQAAAGSGPHQPSSWQQQAAAQKIKDMFK